MSNVALMLLSLIVFLPAIGALALAFFPKDRPEKVSVRYDDIARLVFSGKDTAAGKSFETWVRKYREKKAAGEI